MRIKKRSRLILLVAAMCVGLLGSVHATSEAGADKINNFVKSQVVPAYEKSEWREFNLSGVPWKGEAIAPLSIINFADFNCSHCASMFKTLKHVENKFAGKVKIYFMHFPLDAACNPAVKSKSSGSSCEAASAMVCGVDSTWAMHDELYYSQAYGQHDRSRSLSLAKKMKLDVNEFQSCLDAGATKAKIKSDAQQGIAAKISGTPTLFLNGKEIPSNASHPEVLAAFLEEVLSRY